MANATIDVPSLYGGVSRQAPAIRHSNQVEEADNVLFSVENGMEKRPGSEMVFAVSDLEASADYKLHVIHRDETEKYLIVIGQGTVRAFDTSGTEFNVLISEDAAAYIVANSPSVSELRAITIADYTILLNTSVETGWLDAPAFETADEYEHYAHMVAHTLSANEYGRTLEQEDPWIQTAGYWQYTPSDGTFAKIVFDGVTGDWADYTKYDDDAYNPGGFKANFVRYTLTVTNATWAPAERTLTLADVFADYEWRSGDQIKMTGGADVDAGWYEIESKENDNTIVMKSDDVEGTGDMPVAGETLDDVDATHIGIHSVVTMKFWERAPADMWDVAEAFQSELRKTKGLQDVLVGWEFTDETVGFFTITCPWRGQNATMLATEAPDAGYDFTATTRPFSLVGGEYTITAGTGNPATDHLPPDERWTRKPAPGQTKALPDPAKMPIKMVRSFPNVETYRNNIMADGPFAYWRLGDQDTAAGNGLTGKYYDNWDFTGYKGTRVDSTINFNWGTAGDSYDVPPFSLDPYWWSTRWTGEVKPEFTETYTFYTYVNDGVRLWVNDVLLVDRWTEHAGREDTGTIALTAGERYSITLEYFNSHTADPPDPRYMGDMKLYWSAASQAKEIIPVERMFSAVDASGTAYDEMGGNDGTYIDGPTDGVTGAIADDSDTAITFNGSSEYANVGTLGNFGSQLSNGITLEAWIKPTSTSPDAIMGVRDLTGGTNQEIYFGIPSAAKLEFLITDNNDLTARFRVDTPVIVADTWTHVAVTWHPESPNECQMYINGIAENASRLSTFHTATFSFINFDIDCFLGGENYDGAAMAADYAWSGSLDEVAIYSHVLAPANIIQHYYFGIASTNPFFRLDTIDWKGRLTGNELTNPLPSIIEDEKTISDITLFSNRLGLAGDENLVYSQAADYFNLFIADATDISDSDPIDMSLSSTQVTIIDHVVNFGKRQVIFTKTGQQFETGDVFGIFVPESANVKPSTAYQSIEGVRPVPMENYLYFPAVQKGSTQLLEMFYVDEETSHKATDVSKHCKGYLPTDVQTLQVCLNNNTVLLLGPDDYNIYVYRYHWDAGKKVQSSWAKYVFDSTERIADIGVINNDCFALVEDANNDYYVISFSVPTDVAASGWDYLVHLDNRVSSTGVHDTGTTTWTLTVSDETLDAAVLGPAFGDDSGEEIALTMVSGTSYTAAGDYSAGACQLGRSFTFRVNLSRPYMRGRDGAAILDSTLRLLKLVTNHIDTGSYTIRVEQGDRAARDQAFTPRDGSLLDAEGNSQAFLQGRADNTVVTIRDQSALPTIISSAEYAAAFARRSR